MTTWKKEARSHEATNAVQTVSTPCRMPTPGWSVWRSIEGRRLAMCWQPCCYWLLVFCAKVPQNVRTRIKMSPCSSATARLSRVVTPQNICWALVCLQAGFTALVCPDVNVDQQEKYCCSETTTVPGALQVDSHTIHLLARLPTY